MKFTLSKSQWEQIGRTAGWTGQNGYLSEEQAKLKLMIDGAISGDQVEQVDTVDTNDDLVSRRRNVKVTMDDGDVIHSGINGTKKEIEDYYLKHDFTKSDEKTTHRGIKVEFID